jgi:ribonuclease HI
VEVVKRMRKVNGHSGILLNECADMLATKGVNNEQPPALVQFLVPMGEDTNAKVYELRDGEETRVGSART